MSIAGRRRIFGTEEILLFAFPFTGKIRAGRLARINCRAGTSSFVVTTISGRQNLRRRLPEVEQQAGLGPVIRIGSAEILAELDRHESNVGIRCRQRYIGKAAFTFLFEAAADAFGVESQGL